MILLRAPPTWFGYSPVGFQVFAVDAKRLLLCHKNCIQTLTFVYLGPLYQNWPSYVDFSIFSAALSFTHTWHSVSHTLTPWEMQGGQIKAIRERTQPE